MNNYNIATSYGFIPFYASHDDAYNIGSSIVFELNKLELG